MILYIFLVHSLENNLCPLKIEERRNVLAAAFQLDADVPLLIYAPRVGGETARAACPLGLLGHGALQSSRGYPAELCRDLKNENVKKSEVHIIY